MFQRRGSQLQALLLCILYSVAQSVTPTPTDDEDLRNRVDDNVIYIIVAVVLLFVITVIVVIIVSLNQTRQPPVTCPPRDPRVEPGVLQMEVRYPQMQRNDPLMQPRNLQMQPRALQTQPRDPRMQPRDPRMQSHDPQMNSHYLQMKPPDPRMQPTSDFSKILVVPPPIVPHQSSSSATAVVNEGYEEVALWWEIPPAKLTIYEKNILGSGQFGIILLGDVITDNGTKKCAVKTLKRNATEAERKSLKIELENMSNMDPHPNIVNLIGAQTLNGSCYVVVEYCQNGDLYNYVRKRRSDLSSLGQKESGTTIEYVTRLRIAFDIANGMNYLSTRGFIHRDLAARNVLLDGELRGKVSDFGRSRDISETFKIIHSLRKNEPIPTRWMPVETLRHQIFTTKSDVWSFGVLLWEIESGATRPYNDQDTYRAVVDKVVHEGYRLKQPSYCPDVMYQIMMECWKIDPEERPTFNELAQNLGNLLKVNLAPSQLYSVDEIPK